MAESLINPKDLLARTGVDGGDGGGGINPQCIRIAAGDTPHDFKPGRTANNTSAKADDEDWLRPVRILVRIRKN